MATIHAVPMPTATPKEKGVNPATISTTKATPTPTATPQKKGSKLSAISPAKPSPTRTLTPQKTAVKLATAFPPKSIPTIITGLKITTWQEANEAYAAQYQEVLNIQDALRRELRTLQHMKPGLHHTLNLVAKSSPELVSPEGKEDTLDRYEQEVIQVGDTLLEDLCELVEMEVKNLAYFGRQRGVEFVNGFLGHLERSKGDAEKTLGQKLGGLVKVVGGERDPWMKFESTPKSEELVVDQILNTVRDIVDDDFAWQDSGVKEAAEDLLVALEERGRATEDLITALEHQERAERWDNMVESEDITIVVEEIAEDTDDVEEENVMKGKSKLVDKDSTVITVLHVTKDKGSKPWVSEHHVAQEVADFDDMIHAAMEATKDMDCTHASLKDLVKQEIKEELAKFDEKIIDTIIAAIDAAQERDVEKYGSEVDHIEKGAKEFTENVDVYSCDEDIDFDDTL